MLKEKKYQKSFLAALLFVVVFSGWVFFFGNDMNAEISIRGNVFDVEVVKESGKLQKGLGGRDGLCANCGMLFKFGKEGEYDFWMKDMRFPIDIIWISEQEIVHIAKNINPMFDGTLTPGKKADSVLELKAGTVDAFGIVVGDKIRLN